MQGIEFRLSVVRSTRDSEGADFVYVCATSPPLPDAFDALPDDSVARARIQGAYTAIELAKERKFISAYADARQVSAASLSLAAALLSARSPLARADA